MERVIKFRAWDDINKRWLLGYDYPNLGGFSMKGEVMTFGEYSSVLNSFKLEDWDKIILMQFTGLTDKNGKEIYEGDIIKFQKFSNWHDDTPSLSRHTGIVMFKDGCFMWDIKIYGANSAFHQCNKTEPLRNTNTIWGLEIIDNIYENKELLINKS